MFASCFPLILRLFLLVSRTALSPTSLCVLSSCCPVSHGQILSSMVILLSVNRWKHFNQIYIMIRVESLTRVIIAWGRLSVILFCCCCCFQPQILTAEGMKSKILFQWHEPLFFSSSSFLTWLLSWGWSQTLSSLALTSLPPFFPIWGSFHFRDAFRFLLLLLFPSTFSPEWEEFNLRFRVEEFWSDLIWGLSNERVQCNSYGFRKK